MGYIHNIYVGILIFGVTALVLTIPYLAFNYYKYGSIVWNRAFLVYAFIFYAICAYFMVILPLPSVEDVSNMTGPTMQLMPFSVLFDLFTHSVLRILDPSTYWPALKQGVFTQPIFNLLLTVPFGIFMRYLFNLDYKKTVLCSFLCALFFELTQLSGLYGIYPRPYRLFDVDDLMLNTLGGMMGYAIAPLFKVLFISKETMINTAQSRASHVSILRRFVALSVDRFIVSVSLSVVFNVNQDVWIALGYLVYASCMIMLLNGSTIGMRLTNITFTSDKENLRYQALIRTLMFVVFVLLVPEAFNQLIIYVNSQEVVDVVMDVSIVLMSLSYLGVLGAHILWEISTQHNNFFYERLSHTSIVSTFDIEA
ncbi:hypothetical protein AOC36_08040 [Erysipelothrix larvae]|uniref:VanZ-like domain-containing protein n=1 Tax=Erysipelothrix larvae TaxID=1514105 RepID=A0A0X8H0R6_9FIRM|nr:VanZ family protein [Erysipelothrix larvae]AMC93937.1 hypothetical protein AOC36_08040 [Erysipelothrix larvae]